MIISEYTEGVRNAKVMKMESGGYLVLLWDADREIDEHKSFNNLETAEDYAENWVLKYVTF
jgi:hypothetical protein